MVLGEQDLGFATRGSILIAFNARDGSEVWRWNSGKPELTINMATAGGGCFVETPEGIVLVEEGVLKQLMAPRGSDMYGPGLFLQERPAWSRHVGGRNPARIVVLVPEFHHIEIEQTIWLGGFTHCSISKRLPIMQAAVDNLRTQSLVRTGTLCSRSMFATPQFSSMRKNCPLLRFQFLEQPFFHLLAMIRTQLLPF